MSYLRCVRIVRGFDFGTLLRLTKCYTERARQIVKPNKGDLLIKDLLVI